MIIRLGIFLTERSNALSRLLAVGAMLAGIFYSFILGDQIRFVPDESDYVTLSQNLVTHLQYSLDGQTPTATRSPGYVFLLAVVRLSGLGIVGYRLANFALFALGLLLVSAILRAEVSPLAASLGVLAVLAYPVLFYTAGTLYPQTLAGFLLLAILYLIRLPILRTAHFALLGALSAWLVLSVPTSLVVVAVCLAWLALKRRSFRGLVVVMGVFILLMGAWTLRNALVFHALVPVSTKAGEVLIMGNSEFTTANSGPTTDVSRYMQAVEGMDEITRDRYLQNQVFELWKAKPAWAIRLYALKVLNYFNFRNNLVTKAESSPTRDLVMLVTYGTLLVLGAGRLLMHKSPLNSFEWLLVFLYFGNAFYSAIFFTRIRFRLPFDYLLILLAASFAARWLQEHIPLQVKEIEI